MEKGIEVRSKGYKYVGKTTGGVRPCSMEGCRGERVAVRWDDGSLTFPCTKGMRWEGVGASKYLDMN